MVAWRFLPNLVLPLDGGHSSLLKGRPSFTLSLQSRAREKRVGARHDFELLLASGC